MMSKTQIIFLTIIISNDFVNSSALNKNPKIIIVVGAGPSGIAAASKLCENGYTDVTILEAEDRIGGRVYTTKLGNYTLDLGGQWVHGEKGNAAFDLAHPYGLLDRADKPRQIYEFVDSDGNYVSDEVKQKLTPIYENNFSGHSNVESTYESLGHFYERMFDELFESHPEIISNKRKYLDSLELIVQSEVPADSWYNVSTTNLYRYYEGDQMVNWKTRGFSTILHILMKRFPDPKKELTVLKNTILNSEVESIDYTSEDVTTPVKVKTSDGRIFAADHVIVTVSLGVLKAKHNTLFNPPLPEEKVSAIEKFGFGSVAKIYLLYEEPFWSIDEGTVLHHVFLWNDAERKSIEADPEKSWLLGIAVVYNVEHKPNLLELWISKYAKAMEAQPVEKIFDHCVETIDRFLGKKYNVTKPIAMLRTMWYSNPHFRGAYSYRSVEAHNLSRDVLEEPLQDMKILFAGEATSKHRFALVDGAIASGWKAAERIIDHYNTS